MDIVETTIQEWRELGFHYDRNDDKRTWRVRGSKEGLFKFASILCDFSVDPKNDAQFAHDHYGPYGYLKIMNIPERRGFTENAIHASRSDMAVLASLIQEFASKNKPGSIISLRKDFAPNSEYDLILEFMEDGFDPSADDEWIKMKKNEESS